MTPEQRRQRAQIAARVRHTPDAPGLDDERRALKASVLEDRIREVMTAPPRLTDEQRTRLAEVLLATVSAGGETSG